MKNKSNLCNFNREMCWMGWFGLFEKCLISSDFHRQQSVDFTENDAEIRDRPKHTVDEKDQTE